MLVSEVATQIRYDGASWMDETNLTEETTVPKCSKLSSVASLIIACVLFAQSASPQSDAISMDPVGTEAYSVLTRFFDYDRDIPLDVRVVERTETPDYIREKIVFRGVRDSRVPAYLAVPTKGSSPYPVVLYLHGIGGSKAGGWDDGGTKASLLAAGYAVLALDAKYHGERLVQNGFESPTKMVFERGWMHRYRAAFIQTIVEYRRALDYLDTLEHLDTNRVGALGYSMGGHMTFVLTGVDPRIDVTVACVTPPMNEPPSNAPGLEAGADGAPFPFVVAPYEFAHAVDSRPFLMLMGRTDPVYTVGEAERLYELIDSSSKKLIWYDSGHRLPPAFVGDAVDWFQTHLK